MRKVKQPITDKQDPTIKATYEETGRMYNDVPASEITTGTAYLLNTHSMGEWWEGRTGSKLHTDTKLPHLPGFHHLHCSQDGYTITKTAGKSFDISVVGGYFVWPGDPDTCYEIVNFLSATQIEVARSDTRAADDCRIHGAPYTFHQHRLNKRYLLHIDTRLFYAELGIPEWIEIAKTTYWSLSKAPSECYENGDDLIVVNKNGVFRVAISATIPYYFKMNCPPPDTIITEVDETDALTYGRRYIYSCARFKGGSLFKYYKNVDRDTDFTDSLPADGGVVIEAETGTTAIDNENRDYGEVFTELPVGPGTETYGVLTCAAMQTNMQTWRAVDDGSFEITVNGSAAAYHIMCDFQAAFTLADVASIIQEALRAATDTLMVCEVDENDGTPRLIIRTAETDGSTLTVLAASGVGTDISGAGFTGGAAGAVDNAAVFNEDNTIATLEASHAHNTTGTVEGSNTHFRVFSSKDTGKKGIELGNKPDYFIWNADIPIGKAFTGSVDAGVNLTLTAGRLSQADVGSVIEFEDGTRRTIATVLTTLTGTVDAVGPIAAQSCGIGNDNNLPSFFAFTGHTHAGVLHIDSGLNLTAAHVGMPIFWSDGTISYVTDYDTAATGNVLDTVNRPSIAGVIGANSRSFNDRTTDKVLGYRQGFDEYTPDHRFWDALPNPDMGVVVPGFLVVAEENDTIINYSEMNDFKRYLTGSHNPSRHMDNKPTDRIKQLRRFQDILVVRCARTTWTCLCNNPITDQDANHGITLSLLPNLQLLDDVGVLHRRATTYVGEGLELVVTSEPAVRLFDGRQYGAENLADKQVMTRIKRLSVVSNVIWNPRAEGGIVIYGTEVE